MRMRWCLPLLLAMFCLITTPAMPQGFKNVTAVELKKMIDKKEKLVLVDARSEQEYKEGHIPAAVSIPPEKYQVIQNHLPRDKKRLLIFYCRGTG